ncbi:Hypothetical_protein [Hexamita inflata]|uniref:Hypothetical_protein n=1 Tax=Hexamita inflata TaxID=28002 RepID=A0AA86Q371_9EUKA|nr:Hypothetical protein HINF_LOCUS39034 [Hexamita inflata]
MLMRLSCFSCSFSSYSYLRSFLKRDGRHFCVTFSLKITLYDFVVSGTLNLLSSLGFNSTLLLCCYCSFRMRSYILLSYCSAVCLIFLLVLDFWDSSGFTNTSGGTGSYSTFFLATGFKSISFKGLCCLFEILRGNGEVIFVGITSKSSFDRFKVNYLSCCFNYWFYYFAFVNKSILNQDFDSKSLQFEIPYNCVLYFSLRALK